MSAIAAMASVAEAAAAEALHEPGREQLVHRLRGAARRGGDEEDRDGDDQDALAAVEVAELPVQRHRRDHRERVGGDDPGDAGEPAEVVGDRRERGRDDRAVERAHHLPELQADEDQQRARSRPAGGAVGHPSLLEWPLLEVR